MEIVADSPSEFEKIIQRVAFGESLREICAAMEVPYGRVFFWIADDESRRLAYEAACAEQARSDQFFNRDASREIDRLTAEVESLREQLAAARSA
jgi:hypothetical protein